MEEAGVGAVELVQPVLNVLAGMRVDNVEHHVDSVLVRDVDHVLEVVGRSEAGRRGEEARDLIAEAGVVRVLHDGHHLNGVVTLPGDPRDDGVGEVPVGADLVVLRGDAHVALVDPQRARHLRALVAEVILLVPRRVPDVLLVVGALSGGLWRLNDILGPWRQTIHQLPTLCPHDNLHFRQVVQLTRAVVAGRQEKFPLAERQLLERMRLPLPAVEVAG